MKTRLFTKSAIIMATAFSLASCSQEEELVNPNPTDPTTKPGRTVFSAGGDNGTRTTMDKNRVYYWQYNDQIWVKDGGTWIKSSDSEMAPDNKTANFYFNKVMTADSYEVLYTGFNSNDPTKVTIPTIMQYGPGDRIGVRGDCGVATATRNANGTYSFALLHKGSYLGIAPLKVSYLNRQYAWTKMEIISNKVISGTYPFSSNGIDTTNVTSPSKSITLMGGDAEHPTRFQNYDNNGNYNYFYTVIPPVYRQLDVKYYFVDLENPADTMTYTKRLQPRQWIENNVVQFRHAVNPHFYSWDAPATEPHDGIGNKSNHNATAPVFTKATNVCATMPNPNEMAWYILNGDPRWDDVTEWTIDGGASYHTGGVWIKKKNFITGFSEEVAPNGRDYRSSDIGISAVRINNDTYRTGGKPNGNQYFFLPALGFIYTNNIDVVNMGTEGHYWSSYSSTINSYEIPLAYNLGFDNNMIYLAHTVRSQARVAGNGSDWFK